MLAFKKLVSSIMISKAKYLERYENETQTPIKPSNLLEDTTTS